VLGGARMLPARKISTYDTYEAYHRQQHQEKMRKASDLLEKKQRRYQRQRRMQFLFKSFAGCLIVFGLLSFLVMRYATIFEINYTINGLDREIRELNLQKEDLNVQLDSTIVLDNVERVAMVELGMQYPQPEQIVYINSNWNYTLDEEFAHLDQEPAMQNDIMVDGDNVVRELQGYAAHIRSWFLNKR